MKVGKVAMESAPSPAPLPLADGRAEQKEARPWKAAAAAADDVGPLGKGRKRYRPPDVRTIFTEDAGKRGEGHRFEPSLAANAWCDLCCLFIWHLSLQCTDCKYTCHTHCQDSVQLDCQKSGKPVDHNSCSDKVVKEALRNDKMLLDSMTSSIS